jgi:adenosylmethionine-8-amino-7-oxononanoate aminotransferase
MLQIELVKDSDTKESFTRDDDMQSKVGDRLVARGLLCRTGNNISIAPPLITNREDADEIVDIMDVVLGEVEKELALWCSALSQSHWSRSMIHA